ncbi:MAG TPA: hypothetical protein PKM88_08430, partial [bacterium]|nr:hypothetical protein [bacterium]
MSSMIWWAGLLPVAQFAAMYAWGSVSSPLGNALAQFLALTLSFAALLAIYRWLVLRAPQPLATGRRLLNLAAALVLAMLAPLLAVLLLLVSAPT